MEWIIETIIEAGFNGIYLCEYENELYAPFHKDIQQNVRRIVDDINASRSF
jgi:hypothetical protein